MYQLASVHGLAWHGYIHSDAIEGEGVLELLAKHTAPFVQRLIERGRGSLPAASRNAHNGGDYTPEQLDALHVALQLISRVHGERLFMSLRDRLLEDLAVLHAFGEQTRSLLTGIVCKEVAQPLSPYVYDIYNFLHQRVAEPDHFKEVLLRWHRLLVEERMFGQCWAYHFQTEPTLESMEQTAVYPFQRTPRVSPRLAPWAATISAPCLVLVVPKHSFAHMSVDAALESLKEWRWHPDRRDAFDRWDHEVAAALPPAYQLMIERWQLVMSGQIFPGVAVGGTLTGSCDAESNAPLSARPQEDRMTLFDGVEPVMPLVWRAIPLKS